MTFFGLFVNLQLNFLRQSETLCSTVFAMLQKDKDGCGRGCQVGWKNAALEDNSQMPAHITEYSKSSRQQQIKKNCRKCQFF